MKYEGRELDERIIHLRNTDESFSKIAATLRGEGYESTPRGAKMTTNWVRNRFNQIGLKNNKEAKNFEPALLEVKNFKGGFSRTQKKAVLIITDESLETLMERLVA